MRRRSHVLTPNLLTPNLLTPNLLTPNLLTPNLLTPNLSTPNLLTPNLLTLLTPNLLGTTQNECDGDGNGVPSVSTSCTPPTVVVKHYHQPLLSSEMRRF
jgi:hypothetical protein